MHAIIHLLICFKFNELIHFNFTAVPYNEKNATKRNIEENIEYIGKKQKG